MTHVDVLNAIKADIESQIAKIGSGLKRSFDFKLIFNYAMVRLGLGELGGGGGSGGTELAGLLAIAEAQQCLVLEQTDNGVTTTQAILLEPDNPVSKVSLFIITSVVGLFSGTATVRLEGSPDGTNWETLRDDATQNNNLQILDFGEYSAKVFRITYVSSEGAAPTLNIFSRLTYKGEPVEEGGGEN